MIDFSFNNSSTDPHDSPVYAILNVDNVQDALNKGFVLPESNGNKQLDEFVIWQRVDEMIEVPASSYVWVYPKSVLGTHEDIPNIIPTSFQLELATGSWTEDDWDTYFDWKTTPPVISGNVATFLPPFNLVHIEGWNLLFQVRPGFNPAEYFRFSFTFTFSYLDLQGNLVPPLNGVIDPVVKIGSDPVPPNSM